MKRGTVRKLTANYETFEGEFLGKGMFCTAYRKVGTDRVVCFCGDDTSKEVLTMCRKMKHLPDVERIDGGDDPQYIFEMPYYTPLKASHKEAWKQYRILKSCWESLSAEVYVKRKLGDFTYGYKLNQKVLETAPVSESIKEALEELVPWASNYGQDYIFEFAPRNLCVDNDGNLILLDVLFSLESATKKRNVK